MSVYAVKSVLTNSISTHVAMRYHLVLPVMLNASLLQVVPVATTLMAREAAPGYMCGNEYISDLEVKVAFIYAAHKLDGRPTPSHYYNPEFSRRRHRMYPILTHEISEAAKGFHKSYYVIYEQIDRPITVIAVTLGNEHIQCSRTNDSPRTQTSSDSSLSISHINDAIIGYKCGPEFIGNKQIEEKLDLAQRTIRDGVGYYNPFPGTILGSIGRHLMWPLVNTPHHSSTGETSEPITCFLITSESGSFVLVSYRFLHGDYKQCDAITDKSDAPISTLQTTNRKTKKMGYLCGVFFDDDYISQCIETAKNRKNYYAVFPQLQIWGGEMGDVLLWPLYASKDPNPIAKRSRYYLIMDTKFQTIGVARRFGQSDYRECERRGIDWNQKPENSDFTCLDQNVPISEANKMAEAACDEIPKHNTYPKAYEGPDFDVSGPYLITQPSSKRKLIIMDSIQAVITYDCKLAGVVYSTYGFYAKCGRKDGSTPGGVSLKTIRQHEKDYNLRGNRKFH
ncbi:putative guanyl-specific ribonuclease f1 [Golovinomyces cichoracearum]|uniref:Putative guanyl-specific ribonuclease f1 n=1 Tax=Golovinomyces cichoracearum TaxID=62708 RepID=A0A420IS61_9PEZI|nr:putative guanyl-specific ribonuclease f1 [Golovinomyces cichoracearum]